MSDLPCCPQIVWRHHWFPWSPGMTPLEWFGQPLRWRNSVNHALKPRTHTQLTSITSTFIRFHSTTAVKRFSPRWIYVLYWLAVETAWPSLRSSTPEFKSCPGACFSKVPKLFGRHNSLCIFKTKAFRGTKLCNDFYFYSFYNIWKDQVHRISRSYFYKWLFGSEKFSGLSRNGPLATSWVSGLTHWLNLHTKKMS